MSSASVAIGKYQRALSGLTRLQQQAQQAADQIQTIKSDRNISEKYRNEQIAALREQTFAQVRAARGEITTLLAEADSTAHALLSGDSNDASLEARKARAAMRVGRLLDKGEPVLSIAELFAEAGDLDALRTLRDEIPSVVAAVTDGDRLGAHLRQQQIRELTIALDRTMAPLLPTEEGQAARLRSNIDVALQINDSMGEAIVKGLNYGHIDTLTMELGKNQMVEV